MSRRSKKRVRKRRTRRPRIRKKRTRRRRRRKRLRRKTRRRGGMAGRRLYPFLEHPDLKYSWRQDACERTRAKNNQVGPQFDCDKIKLYKMINGEIPYTRTQLFDEIRYNTQAVVESAARYMDVDDNTPTAVEEWENY